MNTPAIESYLKKWAQSVVHNSKGILKDNKGATELGKSIQAKVTKESQGYSVKFYMLDYGTFLDKGVSGNKVQRTFTNYKDKTEISPYSYKSKGPPIDILSKWVKKKGLKPKGWGRGRDKASGQYVSGLAIYISKKIRLKGIPSISFFSKPFGKGYDQLKKGLLKEFSQDITNYITTFTKHK